MNRGRFVTFEGGEGAGKSTQIGLLADFLRRRGQEALTTREPGGSPGAEVIRALLVSGEADRWDPLTEVLLHFAARRDHLRRTVFPALERGEWVLSDRFADSTLAYQGHGLGAGREAIERVYAVAVGAFRPDLTFILDLPAKAGLARAKARSEGRDRYESMDLGFHERLREGFLEIARAEPERCTVIDATRGKDAVAAEVAAIVCARFPEIAAGPLEP